MKYIDFHTHHPGNSADTFAIQDGVLTRGRHPWHIYIAPSYEADANSPSTSILAIGESGLDRLCTTPYDVQLEVFREEVRLSEQLGKPLILHCVRAIDDVLRIRRELHAQQPCIWHGYRGRKEQLLQLLPHAFYFSFGFHFHAEALQACPSNRLLLETDDDTAHPIADLYAQVALLRNTSVEELIQQMHANFHTLFGIALQ